MKTEKDAILYCGHCGKTTHHTHYFGGLKQCVQCGRIKHVGSAEGAEQKQPCSVAPKSGQ